MRILLIGRPGERARLRAELDEAHMQIVGEFETLEEARATAVEADAMVLADDGPGRGLVHTADEQVEEPLTPREFDVLELLAQGLPNKSIAERLGISDQTVKFHLGSIFGKLGAANRTDAVRRALQRGWLSL